MLCHFGLDPVSTPCKKLVLKPIVILPRQSWGLDPVSIPFYLFSLQITNSKHPLFTPALFFRIHLIH